MAVLQALRNLHLTRPHRLRTQLSPDRIGELCFKGLSTDGIAEIGYGISEEYQNNGYATEAVKAVLEWAFSHPKVSSVEAETDSDNTASKRVLEKCGFAMNGIIGEEGPRWAILKS